MHTNYELFQSQNKYSGNKKKLSTGLKILSALYEDLKSDIKMYLRKVALIHNANRNILNNGVSIH